MFLLSYLSENKILHKIYYQIISMYLILTFDIKRLPPELQMAPNNSLIVTSDTYCCFLLLNNWFVSYQDREMSESVTIKKVSVH